MQIRSATPVRGMGSCLCEWKHLGVLYLIVGSFSLLVGSYSGNKPRKKMFNHGFVFLKRYKFLKHFMELSFLYIL